MSDSIPVTVRPHAKLVAAFGGKVVIVTGAALGIGRSVATMLHACGAKLALIDRRETELSEVAKRLSARAIVADVRDRAAIVSAVESVEHEHGRIDLIFNNAGVAILADVSDHTTDLWREVIETNLMGVVHGVEAVYPIMVRQRSGHIVNTASLSGLIPMPANLAYVTSKFGVVGLSHALRIEAAPLGIRVSVVCPAAVDTGITDRAFVVGVDRTKLASLIPDKPMAPERCALAILEGVLHDDATIVPDAARYMWWMHRNLPFVTRRMAKMMLEKLDTIRVPVR